MLPSSQRLRNNKIEKDKPMTLGDIERFYKKVNTTRDATDARDNSKIKRKYSKTNLDDNEGDEDEDAYNEIMSELNPSYIESEISDKVSLRGMIQEEMYENMLDNGLSIKKHKMTNIKYPFSVKSSDHLTQDVDVIDEYEEITDGEILVEFLVYYINHTGYKPFLEFMLFKSSEDDKLYFPNFLQSTSNYEIVENASLLLDNLLGEGLCSFKGRVVESPTMNDVKSARIHQRIILLYELREKNDTDMRLRHTDSIWWGTVSEIFNYRKIMFYDISNTVTDVFLAYPTAIKIFHNEVLLETPMVFYNGSDSNTAKYNAIFSIKKANNESRYGPFYYFTDLYNAMRYACYDIDTGEKNKKGGVVRFVIYPGKMKVFMKKDRPDKSEMAKYICSLNPLKKKTAQFRDNDCKWKEQYNSAYNGVYKIPIKKSESTSSSDDDDDDNDSDNNDINNGDDESDYFIDKVYEKGKQKYIYYLAMRICISEYNFQTPLSYCYIDTKDVPDKYEYDFKKYKII
jgi:hypothetical protein